MKLRTKDVPEYYAPKPVNFCAQCGETIFVASWSEHVDDQRIRHVWECDACGYAFETLVCYPSLPVSA